MDVAEAGGPADQVVGEHRAGKPRGVGEEPARRAVLEPGAFFEVTDRELHSGVVAVELVDLDGGGVEVGDERVVTPVGPELTLRRLGETGPADHETDTVSLLALAGHVGGVGDLGLPPVGVDDVDPLVVVDAVDRGAYGLVDGDRDRPVDPETGQRVDELPRPEPRIGPQRQRPGRAATADPGNELLNEAFVASLRRPLAEPGMEHLTGISPRREQRVIPEPAGVAVRGAVLGLAVHLTDRRVHVDRHRLGGGPGTASPGTADRLGDHLVELADVTEGERP